MKVSVIVRTKNEERWISPCLDAVLRQEFDHGLEIVVVDNGSTDRTVEKAEAFGIKVVAIDQFRPGRAINQGIRNSSGDVIVCLSGHCIPVGTRWLSDLVRDLDDPRVAGVYGRQEPLSFTSDQNKRDLLTVFGLDRKVQEKDSFFHNANSAFRRELWEQFPFDEDTPNIEDRIWGQRVIAAGYRIVYEPTASVYHHHGIYHEGDEARRRSIVGILETLELAQPARRRDGLPSYASPSSLNAVALIPAKGPPVRCGSRSLIECTIQRALASEYIRQVLILTDNEETASVARAAGGMVPFLRPLELSRDYVDVRGALQHCLMRLEEQSILPDICIVMEQTLPFRSPTLVDDLIERFIRDGVDSLMPVRVEERAVWVREGRELRAVSPFMPRALKREQTLVSLFGLGFVTHAKFIRDGSWGFDRLGMFEVADPYAAIEIRDQASALWVEPILAKYWETQAAADGVRRGVGAVGG